MASWPVTPMTRRTDCGSAITSWPATQAAPASGRVMVVSMRTVVDFPAPLGPSTPRIWPRWTSSDTSATANCSP